MLLVEHYVGPSDIHGLGVFSKSSIKKGELVWQAHHMIDREIPRAALSGLPPHVAEKIKTHAEYLPSVDAFRLAADGDYFMNHSDDPNLIDAGEEMFSARDIAAGEELLCDYRSVRVLTFHPDEHLQINQMKASEVG